MSKSPIPGNGLKTFNALVHFHHGWCIYA